MTSGHKGPNVIPRAQSQRPIFLWQWSDSTSVGLIGDAHVADARRVSEQIVCSECGSGSLTSSGVFEHGTWIHRLTCWTCRDCRTIFTVPGSEASELDAKGAGAPPVRG